MKHRYIVVEGPIGVGKTSLAGLLAVTLGAEQILEQVDNPFLADFYDDREGVAFQTQLYFLLGRHRQQQRFKQRSLFHPVTVSDYLFEKDKIFANLCLNDEELGLYQKVYSILADALPIPDLVISLQASTDVLMQRIRMRSRAVERDISRDYIELVNEAYTYFFYHYSKTPLLVINTDDIDFVNQPKDLDQLVRQVSDMEAGTRFFVPASSD